jgi:hypothetical protein
MAPAKFQLAGPPRINRLPCRYVKTSCARGRTWQPLKTPQSEGVDILFCDALSFLFCFFIFFLKECRLMTHVFLVISRLTCCEITVGLFFFLCFFLIKNPERCWRSFFFFFFLNWKTVSNKERVIQELGPSQRAGLPRHGCWRSWLYKHSLPRIPSIAAA